MASWKKVIVSGSSAQLSSLSLDSPLNVSSGGTGRSSLDVNKVLVGSGSSQVNLVAINGTGSILATTNATGVQMTGVFSGSFSGSYVGDGSGLTGIAVTSLDIDSFGADLTGITIADNDMMLLSDSGTDGRINATQLKTYIYTAISNDITVDATGVATLKSGIVSGSTLASSSQGVLVYTLNGSGSNVYTGLATTDSPTFSGLTIDNNAIIHGNLTVNGTTTTINTTNVLVEDRFLILNYGSGSVSPTQEGGIIIEGTTANSGSAFYFDGSSIGRWAVALDIAENAISVTANSYVVTVSGSASDPDGAPTYGGSANGYGNMYVNTNTGDIFVWS